MIVRELLTLWKIKVRDKELRKFTADLDRATKDIKRGFDNISASVKLTAIAIAGASAAIGFFLKKAGNFEQAQIAFEVMLGSAEKAADLLEQITKFAAKTPFQLTGLIESTKGILAFGFAMEDVIPTLSTLGNIAAGVGTDRFPRLLLALGQVRAATKLRGQELRQFTEAGVPLLAELAIAQGKTEAEIQSMVSAGKIGFKDVNDALVALTTGSGRFANLMVRQSKSFLGIISNIVDALEVTAIAVGQKLLPEAKELATAFLDFLEINREMIATKLGTFMKNLAGFITDLLFAFKRVAIVIKVVGDAFGGLNNLLSFTMKAFAFFIGARLLFGIGLLARGFLGLVLALKKVRVAVLLTQASAIALPLLIGAAVVAAALIIEDLVAFFRGDKSVAGLMKKSFEDALAFLNVEFAKFSDITQAIFTALLAPIRLVIGTVRTLAAVLGALAGGDFTLALKVLGRGLAQTLAPTNAAEALGLGDIKTERGSGLLDSFKDFFASPADGTFGGGFIPGGVGALLPANQPGAAGGGQFMIQVDNTITVPPDTPPQLVGDAVREGIESAMDRVLRTTQQAIKPEAAF